MTSVVCHLESDARPLETVFLGVCLERPGSSLSAVCSRTGAELRQFVDSRLQDEGSGCMGLGCVSNHLLRQPQSGLRSWPWQWGIRRVPGYL